MLRRLHIQNFMSLRDVTVDLSPLTIFIGPNASGKSAIFKALVTLSKLVGPFPVRGPQGEFTLGPAVTLDHLVWQGNSGLPILFRVWWTEDPDEEPGYTLELRKEARGWSVTREKMRLGNKWFDSAEQIFEHQTERLGTKTWKAPYRATLSHLVYPYRNDQAAAPDIAPILGFAEHFGEAWRYRPSANDIASFFKPDPDRKGQPYVGENGRGLSLELQRLQGKSRKLFETIEQELGGVFPHIKLINVQTEPFGVGLAFTTDRSEDLVPASQESDGVLLTTFLLWRLYTAHPNMRLCIEEPENGVHPYLLGERYRLLKRFSFGEAQRPPLQVLVATHSPDFLTTIDQRTEALEMIRVVEFDHNQGTIVHHLSNYGQIDALLEVFNNNLGELWWSGAIGAVPTAPETRKTR